MELYDLATLDTLYRFVKTPSPAFWLPNFFPRQINFTTPQIYFEEVFGDDRALAPFVIPTMPGRPNKLDGYQAKSFRPAYVKMLDPVDPTMFIERQAGEAFITGSLTLEQRRNAVIAELLRKHKQKIQNRLEWLAARAIIDGEVTISGEDYPATLVDFRRDASLDAVLAGAAKWDVGTGDPLATIKAMRVQSNDLTGSNVSRVIFGQNAYNHFANRVDLRELTNKQYGGVQVSVTLIDNGIEAQEYMGRIGGASGQGAFDMWVDRSKFIDPEDGQLKPFLDPDTIVGVDPMVQGVRCFGAIMDKRAGYQAVETFFKNYDQENPSIEYLLSQSSPLMVPKVPNATFKVKVA